MDFLLTILLTVIICFLTFGLWLLKETYELVQQNRQPPSLNCNPSSNVFTEDQISDVQYIPSETIQDPNENQVQFQDDFIRENQENEEIIEEIRRAIGKTEEIGRVNLFVVGQSGVGKSTLLKEMFPEQLGRKVKSGRGDPVTKEINEYIIDNLPLSIFGCPRNDRSNQENVTNYLIKRNENLDPSQHIHLAWYCINATTNRIQPTEKYFINYLCTIMPVVLVLTQCFTPDEEFYRMITNDFPNVRHVVQVVAKKKYDQNTMQTIPTVGLNKLCDASVGQLTDEHAKAFAAAQRVDSKWKKIKCRNIIAAAAVAATTAGTSPIPLSDAAIICPIQAGMVKSISEVFGLILSARNVAAVFGVVTGGAYVGRLFAMSLLKVIPGLGTMVGGAINASTAGMLTTTFGETYLNVLCEVWDANHGDRIDFETALKKFKAKYSEKSKQK